MKKIFLIILCFVGFQTVNSQTEKGKILIGLTTAISNNGISQVGFQTQKRKGDGFESDTEKTFNLNLSPKVGYFLWNNVAVGIEGNLNILSVKDDQFFGDNIKGSVLLGGPFIRYYYGYKTIRPFAEVSALLGKSSVTFEDPEGVDPDSNYKSNIFSVGGGVGLAAQLGNKVSFDTLLFYNRYTEKDTIDNPENERTIISNMGLRVGVTLYF